MLRATPISAAPSHVTAMFNDGSHSFSLPIGSTLGDLAERIGDLASIHEGEPISIHVGFAKPRLRLVTSSRQTMVH